MALEERVKLYHQLEQIRKRPLIVYVTSSRPGAQGMMDDSAIAPLLDQIELISKERFDAGIDVLIVSDGGDPTVAWRAISLLRERTDKVSVLIPQAAYSAATLLALGADEIVMHPNGNLGPVDPQIAVTGPDGTISFGFEELTAFLDFTRHEVGLTDQKHLRELFRLICDRVGPIPVGIAARSSLLSLSMGEKLLRMPMKSDALASKARTIAESLNKSFFHHGYPVGRREANEIGLPIANENSEVEDLIWRIWCDLENDFQVRRPFNPTWVLLRGDEASKLLSPRSSSNHSDEEIPLNINTISKTFEVTLAVLESCRLASREVQRGTILAARKSHEISIEFNTITTEIGWESVSIPSKG